MEIVFLVSRVVLAFMFLTAGYKHVKSHDYMVSYASAVKQPVPYVAGWPAGVALLAGSLGVIFGVYLDASLLVLAAFLVTSALFYHRFWHETDVTQKTNQTIAFWKNISIAGASVALFSVVQLLPEVPYSLTDLLF